MDRETKKELLMRNDELTEEIKEIMSQLAFFYNNGSKFLYDLSQNPQSLIISNSSFSYSADLIYSRNRSEYNLDVLKEAFNLNRTLELYKFFLDKSEELQNVKRQLGK